MGSLDTIVESLWAFGREVTGAALGLESPFSRSCGDGLKEG